MRNMTTVRTSATMGKELAADAMMIKVKTLANGDDARRPATTTAIMDVCAATTTGTTTSRSSTTTRGKHAFRFPRFGLKSPTASVTNNTSNPQSSLADGTPTATMTDNSRTNPRKSTSTVTLATTASGNTAINNTNKDTPKSSRQLRRFPLLRIRGANNSNPADASDNTSATAMITPARSTDSSSGGSDGASTSSHTARDNGNNNCETRQDLVVQSNKIVTLHRQQQQRQPRHEEQHQQQQAVSPSSSRARSPAQMDSEEPQGQHQVHDLHFTTTNEIENPYSCATAILQHSYMEMVCGINGKDLVDPPVTTTSSPKGSSLAQSPSARKRRTIPDDPTVQDSIECVFASQLEEGLALWADDDEDEDMSDAEGEHRDDNDQQSNKLRLHQPSYSYEEDPINAPTDAELPSPAPLMQSRLKSRTPLPAVTKAMIPSKRRSHPSNNIIHNNSKANAHHNNLRFASDCSASSSSNNSNSYRAGIRKSPKRKRRYRTAKMVHVGTFDPRTDRLVEVGETDHNLMEEDPAVRVAACTIQSPPRNLHQPWEHCFCHSNSVPVIPVEYWPQAPLLLRPTPGEGVTIQGIRFSGKTEHFWKPSDGGWWLTPLYETAGKEAPSLPPDMPFMCAQCCVLPINNGNEPIGEALVTDFETPLFEGSLLVRLRHVDGGATSTDPAYLDYDDNKGYFSGLNRRYQVVIRGKFKCEIPVTGLVSGCVMDRPCGRLPPKWITKGAVKVLSFFAPQLDVETDGPRPRTMAPLGSTPQALIVQDVGPNDVLPPLDGALEEPTNAKDSLLNSAFPGSTSLQRARGRKKAFDKLYATKSEHPLTKVSSGSHETYYTFEFLQHLVNFQEFSVELGNLLGSLPIAPILSGQPIPIMAMIREGEQKLWSFDIWHESLVEGAKEHDARKAKSPAAARK